MNKLLLEVYFPQTRKIYDVKVPDEITIGEMKYMIASLIEKIEDKQYFNDFDYGIFDDETKVYLQDTKFVYESGLKNGSKLLLI